MSIPRGESMNLWRVRRRFLEEKFPGLRDLANLFLSIGRFSIIAVLILHVATVSPWILANVNSKLLRRSASIWQICLEPCRP